MVFVGFLFWFKREDFAFAREQVSLGFLIVGFITPVAGSITHSTVWLPVSQQSFPTKVFLFPAIGAL
jgi:hypothetical protein